MPREAKPSPVAYESLAEAVVSLEVLRSDLGMFPEAVDALSEAIALMRDVASLYKQEVPDAS